MRFYNYINETLKWEMPIEEINSLIQKDCKYYLNITQGKYIFNRGMLYVDGLGKKKVRQDRKPRGMQSGVFEKFNKWLEKNGHVRRDKSVIARKDNNKRNMFGDNYYIFPIGKFNYTWVKAKDINMVDKTGWYSDAVDNFFTQGEKTFDNDYRIKLNKPFKEFFTTNKGIDIAWKNQYEIWFDCKEYYYFCLEGFGWHDTTGELLKWNYVNL